MNCLEIIPHLPLWGWKQLGVASPPARLTSVLVSCGPQTDSVLFVLGSFNWLTANINPAEFTGSARMHSILNVRLDRRPFASESSNALYEINYDFSQAWDWNTHVMFTYVVASYESPEMTNSVMIYDRIHQSPTEKGEHAGDGLFDNLVVNKYSLRHQGPSGLKGATVTLKLCANKIPLFGIQSTSCVAADGYSLPNTYIEAYEGGLPAELAHEIRREKPGK